MVSLSHRTFLLLNWTITPDSLPPKKKANYPLEIHKSSVNRGRSEIFYASLELPSTGGEEEEEEEEWTMLRYLQLIFIWSRGWSVKAS